MTIDKAKLKHDADMIFGNGPGLLMAITAKDVRELLAEIERLEEQDTQEQIDLLRDENTALLGRIEQVEAESAPLRTDAERYRWLRNPENDVAILFGGHAWEDLSSEYMDGSIDAVMAKEKAND